METNKKRGEKEDAILNESSEYKTGRNTGQVGRACGRMDRRNIPKIENGVACKTLSQIRSARTYNNIRRQVYDRGSFSGSFSVTREGKDG